MLDHYRLKGWCNLKSALLPKDITNLKYYGGKVVKEYLDAHGGKPKWRGVHTASMYDKHLWYFYTSGMMLDIAQNLLETQTPWLFNDQLVWKMPESGFGFAPHTDNNTGVRIWNKTINCLVILDDINIENGGLMVRNRDNGNWVSPTLKQGDILCIDGDTEHASGENLSDKTRSTYACVYSKDKLEIPNFYQTRFYNEWKESETNAKSWYLEKERQEKLPVNESRK